MNIFFVVVLFFGVIVQTEHLLNDERDRNGSCPERRRLGLRSVIDDRGVQESSTTNCMVMGESLNAYHQRKRDTAHNDAERNESGAPAVGDGSVRDGDEAGDESGGGEGPHISNKFEQSLQLHVTDAVRVNAESLQRTTEAVTEAKAVAGTGTEMGAGVVTVGTDLETSDAVGAKTHSVLKTGTGIATGIGYGTERMMGNWTGTGIGNEIVTGNCAGAEEAGRPTGFQVPPGDFHVNVEVSFSGHKRILTAKDATWQNVSGTKHKFIVYSAFYDRRGNRTVRIIGVSKVNDTDHVWCRLWYKADDAHADASGGISNQSCSIFVPAEVRICNEHHGDPHGAVFVLCALSRKMAVPSAVSVVSSLHRPPANLLLVRNTDADLAARNLTAGPVGGQSPMPPSVAQAAKSNSATHAPDTIAVCVKQFHSKYNEAMRILEFFELNTILGVQHFTMYNLSVGDQVSCLLRDYVERGIVTLLPWEFDMSSTDIHTYGILACLNDCLYRSMYKYKYTALFDVDEFIIPRHHSTLQEFIKWMDTHVKNHDVGSYSFQNFFFYLEWNDDPGLQGANLLERQLLILRKTRKSLNIYPHMERSKYIIRPELVEEAGNHFVWEFVPGHRTFNVKPDDAILQHYRFCDRKDCVKDVSVVDKTAYRYRERLAQRVRQRYSELQRRCDLPPMVDHPMTLPTPLRQPPMDSKAVSRGEYASLLSPRFTVFGNILLRIVFSLLLLLI